MDTIQAGCSEKVGIFIQAISYFVAAFVVGFILDARLTGILLASVVLAITLTFVIPSPMVSKCSRSITEKNERANDVVESALGAVKIVQAFDMIEELCRRHVQHVDEATRANLKKAVFAALQAALVYFIAYSANALAFFLGSREATGGDAGTVYAVVFLILDASFVVGQFAPFLEIFARAAAAKATIQELLDESSTTHNSGTYRKSDLTPDFTGKDIEFSDVEFQYPARPTVKTLKGLNLKLEAGTFISIVGKSGGGKSTLVALLLGIYDYSGHINVGEDDIKTIDSGYLRSQIAVLDQYNILFSGTVFDNVCYGLLGQAVSEEEKSQRCEQALKDANVDFLTKLPQGVHTKLSNEVQLSGGQRQRVCLARALIKRPAVLILDEPTAALDARSEVAVVEAVKKVAATGVTVIMIAHRLSTTLDSDLVAVVSEGDVVESGTPRELASREDSVFRGLLDAQNTTFNDTDQAGEEGDPLSLSRTKSSHLQNLSAPEAGEAEKGTQDEKKLTIWTIAKRIGNIMRSDSLLAVAGLLASIISGGILLGQAVVFGNLITLLNTGNSNPDYYNRADMFSLIFFILALVALASYLTSGTVFGVISSRITGRMQTRLLHKLLHLDVEWFSETGHSVQQLMSKFTKDPGDLSALGGVALGAIFTIFTSVIGGIILSHIVAWMIAVVLLAAVPVMLVAGWARLRLLTASEQQHREAYTDATALAAEACRNRRAVTALCLEQHLIDEYQHSLQTPFKKLRNFVYYANKLLALCFSITYFVYALAYWWGSQQVRNGSYSTTASFIVLPVLLFSAQSAGHFFSLSPEIARAKTASRSVFTLLDAQPKITASKAEEVPAKSSTTSSLVSSDFSKSSNLDISKQSTQKLGFRDVTLLYPNSSKASLSGVNLSITSGQTVAFVGPSGAGKSSAMALIERFYDVTEGAVLFDGRDLRDMDLGAPRGVSVTDEDVQTACQKCDLHEFITSLPEGYSTECGSSSSSRLSGGQKQRLAIARALVRNPDVLLLDEPTSALDAHSEAHVQESLNEAAKGRTTIIVAHRLASIQHADQIFVFDQGKLVAKGTHAELVQQGGLYATMAKTQALV
ncbi:Putative Type 1 protein exporter [Septoria linicola]|uniref:Type 1 protein exporter n=1 Tax=Septoria linicola TaxID=215465 RepID=A0A9Q9EN74_9PEZI|nr:Putative Type 1 protein exporter [Septoria linicola]